MQLHTFIFILCESRICTNNEHANPFCVCLAQGNKMCVKFFFVDNGDNSPAAKNIKFKKINLLTCRNIISLMDVSFEAESIHLLGSNWNKVFTVRSVQDILKHKRSARW